MELEEFFSFKDFFRTMFLASALIFIIGTAYGVMLHAMYTSQIMGVKQDLKDISYEMGNRTTQAYEYNKTHAKSYRRVKIDAEKYSDLITPPSVTPYSYIYFNYWVASAAFTNLKTDPPLLGLNEDTIKTLDQLNQSEVFGIQGWWDHPQFRDIPSTKYGGAKADMLLYPPKLETHFWSFYIFILMISFVTAFVAIKEEYDIPALPEAIYGALMPLPFFVIYSFTSLLSYFEIVTLLDKDQVSIIAVLASFIIMSILSIFSSLAAVGLKKIIKQQMEQMQ